MVKSKKNIPDKNIDVNGRLIGANSIIKFNVKTAVWILGIIFFVVMTILTYSYFDLKGDVEKKHSDFVNSVNTKIDKMQNDVTDIRIGQEGIKGDIKLILYKQDQEANIKVTNKPIESVIPPTIVNIVPNDSIE